MSRLVFKLNTNNSIKIMNTGFAKEYIDIINQKRGLGGKLI